MYDYGVHFCLLRLRLFSAALACGLLFGGAATCFSQLGYLPVQALNTDATTDLGVDEMPTIATDGTRLVTVWSSSNDNETGTDLDLYVAHSTDGGQTWSAPAFLNADARVDTGDEFRPQLASGGSGVWIVAWDSDAGREGSGTDHDIFLARSSDHGLTWSPPQLVTRLSNAGIDMNANLATDRAGNWVLVWDTTENLDGGGNDQDVAMAASSDNGLTWTLPTVVSTGSSALDLFPSIDTDRAGTWTLAWSHAASRSNIRVVRSNDRGATWTDPVELFADPLDEGQDCLPQVRYGSAGTWLVAWESGQPIDGLGSDQDILCSRSVDGALTWSAPAALNGNAQGDGDQDFSVQIAPDGAGRWMAVWASEEPPGETSENNADIKVSLSSDHGQSWSMPVPLAEFALMGEATDIHPVLVATDPEHWQVAWSSDHDLNVGTDSDILTVTVDQPVVWRPASVLNDNSANQAQNDTPELSSDRNGNWLAVWRSNDNVQDSGSDYDILYSQSSDGGMTWSSASSLQSNAGTDVGSDSSPVAAPGVNGRWITVWDSTEDLGNQIGTDRDILMMVSDDAGQSWSGLRALSPSAGSDQGDDYGVSLATDGAGHWMAVWMCDDSLSNTIGTDLDTVFSVSTNDGQDWTAPVPLSSLAGVDSGDDLDPVVATDGAGRWLVTWVSKDPHGNTLLDDADLVYVISDDLGTNWTAPEPLNSNATSDGAGAHDLQPDLVTDGQGNWLAAWHSDGSLGNTIGTDLDILYTRSSDNGTTWTAPQAVSSFAASDTGDEMNASIDTDGQGNWIISWDSSDPLFGASAGDTDLVFAHSTDAGATWSAPGPVNSDGLFDDYQDSSPSISAGRPGHWVTVWTASENQSGAGANIMVAHVSVPALPGSFAVSAGPDRTIVEGTRLFLDLSQSFGGESSPYAATVDWGDGTIETAPVDEVTGTVKASHLYTQNGLFAGQLSVLDNQGQVSEDPFLVTVENSIPVIVSSGARMIPPFAPFALDDLDFLDFGFEDTHVAQIDWGDGVVESGIVDPVHRVIVGSHDYVGEGPYTVTVFVTDSDGGTGQASFTACRELAVSRLHQVGDLLNLEWRGGSPPFSLMHTRDLVDPDWQPISAGPSREALVDLEIGAGYLHIDAAADPCLPPYTINVNAHAERSTSGGGATVVVDVNVSDASGQAADPPSLVLRAGFGLDEVVSQNLVRQSVGVYQATLESDLAGDADVLVEIPGLEIENSTAFYIPPGPAVELEIVQGAFVFPDGVTPRLVTLSLQDEEGNPLGSDFSNLEVVTSLPFELRYNACHEAELLLRSTVPGRFPVAVTDTISGFSETFDVVFPVAGIRPAEECPALAVAPGDSVRLTIPVDLHLAEGWDFNTAHLEIYADEGMRGLATLVGIVDGDPEDAVTVGGYTEGPEHFIEVTLNQSAPASGGPTRILLQYDTIPGGEGPGSQEGRLDLMTLTADTVHPYFGSPVVPISNGLGVNGTYLCSSKMMYTGCVMYVRTTLRAGQVALTDEQIYNAHRHLNEVMDSACIYLDKVIAPVTVTGNQMERAASSEAKIRNSMRQVRRVLAAESVSTGMNARPCLVVGIFNRNIGGGKAVSMDADYGAPLAPIDGTTLIEFGPFGNPRSLAHEIGHHLDPNAGHTRGRSNLMTPTDKSGRGVELSDTQQSTMQGSKWLKGGIVRRYLCIQRLPEPQ
jgi:hypothetical protein